MEGSAPNAVGFHRRACGYGKGEAYDLVFLLLDVTTDGVATVSPVKSGITDAHRLVGAA